MGGYLTTDGNNLRVETRGGQFENLELNMIKPLYSENPRNPDGINSF